MKRVHVVGAGLAGLACALRLARAGNQVALYEAAGHAGGRCRSFFDDTLGCIIDNGSHMVLGANRATLGYLADSGAVGAMAEIAPATFPFVDVATGERWRIAPGRGPLPFWLLDRDRRVAGSGLADYAGIVRLARAAPGDTVSARVGTTGRLYERFWQPLCRAVLNTDASEGSARLLWATLRATFLRGERACRPFFFPDGLSAALVDPALQSLAQNGVAIRFHARLRDIALEHGRAVELGFADGGVAVAEDESVVLAVPAEACAALLPGGRAPRRSSPILNAHYHTDGAVGLPWGMPFLGLVGSEAQWLFARGNAVSVTVSAAGRLIDRPGPELAETLWREIAPVLGRPADPIPPWRIVKERRATIAQTPEEVARRPSARTAIRNVVLAGDWTDTGLPATIEGSIRSGFRAAEIAGRGTAGARAA